MAKIKEKESKLLKINGDQNMQTCDDNLKTAKNSVGRTTGRVGQFFRLILALTFLVCLFQGEVFAASSQEHGLRVDLPVGQEFLDKQSKPDPIGRDYSVTYRLTFLDGPTSSGAAPMPADSRGNTYTFSVKGTMKDQAAFTIPLSFSPFSHSPGLYRYQIEVSPDQDTDVRSQYKLDTVRYICQLKVLNDPSPGQGFKLSSLYFNKLDDEEGKLASICFSHIALADRPSETTAPSTSTTASRASASSETGPTTGSATAKLLARTGEGNRLAMIPFILLALALVLIGSRRYSSRQ